MEDTYPNQLPGFVFREAGDKSDEKLLGNIREYGWHVVMVPDDDVGPGFAYTVGTHLRTLQPEILMMGLPMELAHGLLNGIAEYLMDGGTIVPEQRYPDFIVGRDVIFRPIHETQYRDYLGCANWFYRPLGRPFPAVQCFWPDSQGRFPHEADFDPRYAGRQIDLSQPLD